MTENGPEDVVLSDEEIEAAQGGGAGSYEVATPGEMGTAGTIEIPGEIGREHGEGIIVE